jgi:chemotaxis protein methyltransferase CheR
MKSHEAAMALELEDFHYFRTLLQRKAAIVLEDEKAYLVESRLSALSHREGFGSLNALATHMRSGGAGDLQRKVVEAMTTNETSFFRDGHPFEALRLAALPELIRRRGADHTLNIWCAACSTGQEPYSVAILLREHFPQLERWNTRIIGSDLSTDVLTRARLGRFCGAEVHRGLPTRLLDKYFQPDKEEWRVRDHLRRMVEYRVINLIDPWPALPALDLVLLRNVLIYFDVPTKRTIFERVRKVLRPDGYLLLGGSETTLNLHNGYDRVRMGPSIAYQPRAGA